MQDHDVRPNEFCYNCMIDAAAKAGDTQAASFWVSSMVDAGFHVDVVGGNAAIEGATVSTGKHNAILPQVDAPVDVDADGEHGQQDVVSAAVLPSDRPPPRKFKSSIATARAFPTPATAPP